MDNIVYYNIYPKGGKWIIEYNNGSKQEIIVRTSRTKALNSFFRIFPRTRFAFKIIPIDIDNSI